MTNRRRLDRERLEIYLVHLLLAYRRLIFIVAILMLTYAVAITFIKPVLGLVSLLPAVYLLLLSNSYNIVLHTARLAAWIGTVGTQDD